jgi:alpha-beta hydrolase superfamily lysophospholipase
MQSLASSSAPTRVGVRPRTRTSIIQRRPSTVLVAAAAAAPAASVPAQTSLSHPLPDGCPLELVYQPPASQTNRPAVLLVHGSYHAAWCWRDTFMPYLAERGWPSYAVSLRGQGASGRQAAAGVAKGVAGTLATHADDLASVVAAVARGVGEGAAGAPPSTRPPPVVCAHSFGGLILEELVSRGAPASSPPVAIAGAAYLGSVPPSGNKAMVGRFLKRDPWASAKLTYAFIAASFAKDAKTCRECFLSAEAPDSLVEAVRSKIAAQLSPLRLIDLTDMNRRVPLPPPSAQAATPAPALVLRGVEDGVVDAEAAEELAAWCGSSQTATTRVEIEGLAHDVMLDVRWEEAARELVAWLEKI